MHTRVYMQAYTMFVVYSLANAYINIQLWSNRHRYLNRFLGACSMSIVALAMGQSDGAYDHQLGYRLIRRHRRSPSRQMTRSFDDSRIHAVRLIVLRSIHIRNTYALFKPAGSSTHAYRSSLQLNDSL